MKISFITTIYNEEKSIINFLDSLFAQITLPDEIIIVDGGSNDNTVGKIKSYVYTNNYFKNKFSLIIKKGNRSIGRNEAVKKASGNIIACSDAGNIMDKNWLKNITAPFSDNNVDAVAGYYKGKPQNVFQKCLIPYALVMPDNVNPDSFLPSTRSFAFRKSIWKKAGGFPEEFSHNEDYVFAKTLTQINARIYFAKNALVYWIPRNSYKDAFIMFFRFALGDAESGMFRPKVVFLFIRYIIYLSLFILFIISKSEIILNLIIIIFEFYVIWSFSKNFKYVKDMNAIFILPLLQFTADFAVMTGTIIGLYKRYQKFNTHRKLKI